MSNLQLFNILEDIAYALLDKSFIKPLFASIFEDENINSLMKMSNDIDEIRRQTKMGVTSGRLASIVGGVLSVGAAMLLPFTLGLSLIITGASFFVTEETVSADFSLHKFVRDRQKSKTLLTCAMKFLEIRDKLARIAVAINSVLVYVNVLRKSKMWGEVQIQSNGSSIDTLIQLWKEIGYGCISSDPDAAINDVLDKATRLLNAFEDIIEESNITDVQLHPRIRKDIIPASEKLNITLQNLYKGGFREGMNIGKLLLAFFTEQFDYLYKGADLDKIRKSAYPEIAKAVNGSSGKVIRPISVNRAHATGGRIPNYGILDLTEHGQGTHCSPPQVFARPGNYEHVQGTQFSHPQVFARPGNYEIFDDVASAGASVRTNAAVKVSRGIPIAGILFASLGTVSESYNFISHRMDVSKNPYGERVDLSKQFYELAVIMALTNTIVSSPDW